jgi:hypothetical protein
MRPVQVRRWRWHCCGRSRRWADVYGDQASLLVVFSYGLRRHGLVALVDFNHLGGWVKDLFVTVEPAAMLRELRNAARSEPLSVLDRVDPAEARRLLEQGLAATDATWMPEVSQELRQCRALALARCRAMPEPERVAEPEREIGEAERAAIVAEFLASPHARGLPDGEAVPICARLLVDFGADYDDGKPLRVSPAKIEGFLLDWVPAKAMLDDTDRDAMPAVVTAWVRWAGERTGLPAEAAADLVKVATECGAHFAEVYQETAAASPVRLFLRLVGRRPADRPAQPSPRPRHGVPGQDQPARGTAAGVAAAASARGYFPRSAARGHSDGV